MNVNKLRKGKSNLFGDQKNESLIQFSKRRINMNFNDKVPLVTGLKNYSK